MCRKTRNRIGSTALLSVGRFYAALGKSSPLLSCWSLVPNPAPSFSTTPTCGVSSFVARHMSKHIWLNISATKEKRAMFSALSVWLAVLTNAQLQECLGTNKAEEICRWGLAFRASTWKTSSTWEVPFSHVEQLWLRAEHVKMNLKLSFCFSAKAFTKPFSLNKTDKWKAY